MNDRALLQIVDNERVSIKFSFDGDAATEDKNNELGVLPRSNDSMILFVVSLLHHKNGILDLLWSRILKVR